MPDIANISSQISERIATDYKAGYDLTVYTPFLLRTLGDPSPKQYDHRYFYRTSDRLCSYICGFAKDSLIVALSTNHCQSVFLEPAWLSAINNEKTALVPNNALIGSLVEPTVIAAIVKDGIHLPLLGKVRPKLQYFEASTERGLLVEKNQAVLYVPNVFNYTNIDAVLRVHKNSTLHIYGIQITVGTYTNHKESATKWIATPCCSAWLGSTKEFIVAPPPDCSAPSNVAQWNFVWIMPFSNFPSSAMNVYSQISSKTRSQVATGTPQSPAYTELFYGFGAFLGDLNVLD
jgi:hypothetical protein